MSEPTAGRWVPVPPTVTAEAYEYYWWRANPLQRPQPVAVWRGPPIAGARHFGEWWSIPLEDPQ
jgi:hypothetical protein